MRLSAGFVFILSFALAFLGRRGRLTKEIAFFHLSFEMTLHIDRCDQTAAICFVDDTH